jgi:hypothetical protein
VRPHSRREDKKENDMNDEFWSRKVWRVREASEQLARERVVEQDQEFFLQPNLEKDGTASYYTLKFERNKMNEVIWKGLQLVPAGDDDLSMSGLPPIETPAQPAYSTAVFEVCQRLKMNPSVRRLEGVINVDGTPEVVQFLCFPGAQQNGRDWMMIQILRTVPNPPFVEGEATVRQGGTVHGDPK